MESYKFLLDIAIILISTKIFGMITRKLQMPQVVGALIAGIIFGPAFLNILQDTDFLKQLSELGVIVIMFTAGMTTDIRELKHAGKSGMLVAMIGVLVPLGLGTLLGFLFSPGEVGATLIQHVFVGTILTATSVSITVETLKEIGKLNTKVGNTILAAALIDDVLGLIVLTVVTSLAGDNVNVLLVLLKILLFFIFVAVVAFVCVKLLTWYENKMKKNLHRYPLLAFVLCLTMAYVAKEIFGVADIIGAFSAGIIIANTPKGSYIESKFEPVSYLFLSPVFFASIGLQVSLSSMNGAMIIFTVLLVLTAVLSKLIGCALGAKMCKFTSRESIQVGLGMACRGEVALVVANTGAAMGLMPDEYFGPIIIMVVCCAVFTPVALKAAFAGKGKSAPLEPAAEGPSSLVNRYEEPDRINEMTDEEARRKYFNEEPIPQGNEDPVEEKEKK